MSGCDATVEQDTTVNANGMSGRPRSKSGTKYLTMQLDEGGESLVDGPDSAADQIAFASAAPPADSSTGAGGNRSIPLVEPQINPEWRNNSVSTSKYNALTFIPKFLFEQFSRYANMFFLLISVLQQVPGVSPTGRWTTIVPLGIVLAATAVKELLEDWKRHEADRDVNNRLIKVFREGTFQTKLWTEVRVGDIVKVLDGQFFPADLVLLSSSEPQAMCYIETANLDGETNLKIRQGLSQTAHLTSTREIRAFTGAIDCEGPNNRLYKFIGNIRFTSSMSSTRQQQPMSADQLLLRGAQLRNTPWVYGAVVYTGHETKLMQNSTAAPSKRSNVDDVTNRQILGLFVLLLVLALITTTGNQLWMGNHKNQEWYLEYELSPDKGAFYNFLTSIILFNMLIPISLIVTLETVKYFQGLLFINMDLDMYHAESDTPARAVTSTLNEELGQVQYIFSDKTGTLTRNMMQFLKCSIGGISYGDVVQEGEDGEHFTDPSLLDNLTGGHPTASIIREWLTLLAVCHTVVPERSDDDPDKIVYQAASPDEAALVEAVKKLGFSFNERSPETVFINALGKEERYEILNVLEFNSTRKRMSVIVRTPTGAIKLYCKGADSVIYERLNRSKQPFAKPTEEHLRRFAADGLRTLCLAVAQLTEQQYVEWNKSYEEAAAALTNRSEKLDEVAEKIEKDLFLLGASAIEDKLQEGVPETIRKLANAGIKIWVLTGDKQETAINIGFSCRLLTQAMDLLICNEDNDAGVERWINETNTRLNFSDHDGRGDQAIETLALIIDGGSLTHALGSRLSETWLRLARRCKAVICCRVSPLQKADIVRLVKKSVKAITLAIGDGANDVGMIQAAHVGVGISGQEGLQAARASDYAIAQFMYLQKLLLVHGNWSYRRITTLILYFLYKNATLTLMELYRGILPFPRPVRVVVWHVFYAFYNGFSGQILFEEWMIASFNIFFTLLPPLVIGVFEQHASKESLLTVPELYKPGQSGSLFNFRVFCKWAANAFWHCTILFFPVLSIYGSEVPDANGQVVGQWVVGSAVFGILVYTVTLKGALITQYWTSWTHVSYWGSIVFFVLFCVAYMNMWKAQPFGEISRKVYGVDAQLFGSFLFWLSTFLVPVMALFVDYTVQAFQVNFFPTADDLIRKQEKSGGVMASMYQLETLSEEREGDGAKHTGFAFSQSEMDDSTKSSLPSQADIIRRYDTEVKKPDGE